MKNFSEGQIFHLSIKIYFVKLSPLQDQMLSFYSNILAKTIVIKYLILSKLLKKILILPRIIVHLRIHMCINYMLLHSLYK